MFERFARRMTLLYAAVAAGATVLLLIALAVCALYGYIRQLDEIAAQTAVHASSFGARARQSGEAFEAAAIAFEREDAHAGVLTLAASRPPAPPDENPGAPLRVVIDGTLKNGAPPEGANRLGFYIAELFGARARHVAFDGGRVVVAVDPSRMALVLGLIALSILVAGGLAGLTAWFAGRYIAAEALQPLVEVTQALQRFAARDFTPEPIAVAGRSEFDAVAEAYNAAAVQVDAAFLEHERADERIRQFVADAGHELRTPLTVVLGYTEHLRRIVAPSEPGMLKAFESIDAEGTRMRALIDNLVLLARLDSEERGFVEPFVLHELLEELAAARRLAFPGAEIQVAGGEEAQIFASRDDVREALGNVLDNALKYGAGSPVRVGVERFDETRIRVTVADGGPGIAAGAREAVFERFYRGEAARDVAGSGLGLAIARRALQRAGGRIWLRETPPDAGATFVCELPAGAPVEPARRVEFALTGGA
jgi:signal transduction histidine kinase